MHEFQLIHAILFLAIALTSVKLIQDLLNQLVEMIVRERSAEVAREKSVSEVRR
jgi:hypothetical protein